MKSHKGRLITFTSVLFIGSVLFLSAAMAPVLFEALNTGFQTAENPLTKAFMAGFFPLFLFLVLGSAAANTELSARKKRRRRAR